MQLASKSKEKGKKILNFKLAFWSTYNNTHMCHALRVKLDLRNIEATQRNI
jgi:hypothetical protein